MTLPRYNLNCYDKNDSSSDNKIIQHVTQFKCIKKSPKVIIDFLAFFDEFFQKKKHQSFGVIRGQKRI